MKYIVILVSLCLLIAFKNYTPDTFLTGWDTLHPEFDFPLNFSRLFSLWRFDQGLGDLSGHSHMADLPRVFILWLFHFILPLNFLRYSYIFLCLLLGPLGIYFLIKFLFPKNLRSNIYDLTSFLSALFYLLNLSTVQIFFVPFEMFPTQWAFLPWIILSSLKFLQKPSTFRLLTFGLLTLLSTPQSYAAHLWYPFFAIYCLFILLQKSSIELKIILISLTLLINSFWLLPNLYYVFTSSSIPQYNKSNLLHSQEFLLRNRQTGTILDTLINRGFYFNWDIFNFQTTQFEKLMPLWQQHLEQPIIYFFGFFIAIFSLTGLFLAFYNRQRLTLTFLPFLLIPFILLSNRVSPFNKIFDFLVNYSLLQETFRFIFTKMSVLFLFGITIYFSYFLTFLFHSFSLVTIPFSLLITFCLLIFAFPVFQGQLISPQVRIKIPTYYFQFWDFMKSQPAGLTLALPLHETSGWNYYSWGYQGSGFLWFGLPQSILDRDSDRWSFYNEESYREFFTALYSNNPTLFSQTLNKYHIRYLLWDTAKTATSPKNVAQITFQLETQWLIGELISQKHLSPLATFGSLSLYQTNNLNLSETITLSREVNPPYRWHYTDPQYQNQNYYSTNSSDNFYPFRNILTPEDKIDTTKFPIPNNLPSFSDHQPHRLSALNDTKGISFTFENLPHRSAYILGIRSQFSSGIPIRLCLKNLYTNLCQIENQLSKYSTFGWDYFLITPAGQNQGYRLELNAISYANLASQSSINQITLIPFDYIQASQVLNNPRPVSPQPFYVLYQSFHPGWLAFYFDGLKPVLLQNHLLINNWANGWQLPITDYRLPFTVYVLFLPEILEFLGFGFLISSFIYTLKR